MKDTHLQKKSRKPLSFRDLSFGVFSSCAKEIGLGWRLLAEARNSPKTARTQHSPRSFTRITEERLRLIIADYEAGLSAYELAGKYRHNRGTIMKHLPGTGVRSRVVVPTADEIFRWRELWAEGLGFKTIANRVGVKSQDDSEIHLRELGILQLLPMLSGQDLALIPPFLKRFFPAIQDFTYMFANAKSF
ncbi:hypothetical protein [Leucobacter chromiiresistens]|uniref:hypothetical protein n=1 Tax=Leucobacter chromiiresistens TaxID=1079994 RepID=UPI00128F1352|nr:hypothetical protein [Leucobacter chromiiresistens]